MRVNVKNFNFVEDSVVDINGLTVITGKSTIETNQLLREVALSTRFEESNYEAITIYEKSSKHFKRMLVELIGGDVVFNDRIGGFEYIPNKSGNRIATSVLRMEEAAVWVKGLINFVYHIKYITKERLGVFFLHEPESHLHPSNQRLIAQILVMLVHYGVKVAITTHSDYLISEFNNAIRINYLAENKKSEIMKEFSYSEEMLLEFDKYNLYTLENGKVNKQKLTKKWGAKEHLMNEVNNGFWEIAQEISYRQD